MSTDTISNLLTSIRNGAMRKKSEVEVPYSKVSERILAVLHLAHYIEGFKVFKHEKSVFKGISIKLKYADGRMPVINVLKQVSKPGLRIYKKSSEIEKVLGGLGMYIVSTPRGIISSSEARKKKLGGEIICKVY